MLLQELRAEVLDANLELVRRGLVLYTFGNASGIDRTRGLVAIKPSGVPYEQLKPEDMVVTDLEGRIVDGHLRPSSDLATHLELYKCSSSIGAVVHTHSEYATSWAQARTAIPSFGTTHADYFFGSVPVTEELTAEEIATDYERNTGVVIRRLLERVGADRVNAVLVAGHAPFCWGATPAEAAHTAVVLEYVARMAMHTKNIAREASPISDELQRKHYFRKHGTGAYYGQGSKGTVEKS